METIGIRALKQNASAVIARVEAGESFEVTNRGRVVGTIVPKRQDRYQELVDAGVIVPPRNPNPDWAAFDAYMEQFNADLIARGLPTGNTSGMTMQEILDEQRADRL